MVATGILGLSNARPDDRSEKDERMMGELRPDQALVYIMRVGTGIRIQIFCNDHLVGNLKKDEYTFVHLPPGTHVFWHNQWRDPTLFDFAAA